MRTSLYSIFCILIRLGAVIMAISTIVAIPAAWVEAQAAHVVGYEGMLFGFGGAMIALAALLWLFPGVLAGTAAGKASRQIFESPITADALQQIAFAILGTWFVITALAGLAGVGARIIVTSHISDVLFSVAMQREYMRIVPLLVEFALGIALAMSTRGVVGWIRAFQDRGLAPAVAENMEDPAGGGTG
ncbi:MAG TPA: hypothetical protein VFV97_07230 [Rhodanobacteraceae bacterium]|nr:hypothetical protein [Rhodanobacteraceae bacterium]